MNRERVKPWFPFLARAAFTVALAAAVGGGVSSQLTSWADHGVWRWVTWLGLVGTTAFAVLGWWRSPPPPAAPPNAAGLRPEPSNPPTAVAPLPKHGTAFTRFLSRYAEPLFTWLIAYPLFPLPIVFFWLVSWGNLGDGLGFPDLVWYEYWFGRFWAGASVALLFGVLLFVRYVLDDRPGSSPTRLFGESPSLFWFVKPRAGDGDDAVVGKRKVRQLGAFLFWLWPATLAVFYVPKAVSEVWGDLAAAGAMAAGLTAAVVATLVVVWVYERWLRDTAAANWALDQLPGFNAPERYQIPKTDRDLHGLAGVVTAIPTAFLALFLAEHAFWGIVWSPVWLLCLFLALFTLVYGFVTFHLGGLQYVLAVLAVLVIVACNTKNPYRMSFPGLEGYEPAGTADAVDPDDPDAGRAGRKATYDGLELVETDALLKAFHGNWAGPGAADEAWKARKPKLVIVASTGGGIQAAVWTAVVLEGLEREIAAVPAETPDTSDPARPHPFAGRSAFRDHIRLMTGASGGMQAAALYAAKFTDPPDPLAPPDLMSTQLARDSLWRTVQKMLIHDVPGVAVPWRFGQDRGRSLERAWAFNTHPWKDAAGRYVDPPEWYARDPAMEYDSPFRRTFAALRADEAKARRPSLVFAPMLVEDCRRLLISNLEMSWFEYADGSHLNAPLPKAYGPVDPNRLSVPAVGFWRLFPNAYRGEEKCTAFTVGTAARMSATFPFVGPAVSLPTNPPRRVVDAGYFDNFGINLAALWLYRHKWEIEQYTSGVVIVEIRAYPRRAEKLKFTHGEKKKEELMSWAMSELSTPAEAIINLYSRAAYFRNDQLLDVLDKEFNGAKDDSPAAVKAARETPPEKKFFTTVVFECDQPAALSWTLPSRDLKNIRQQFGTAGALAPGVADQIENLKRWFDRGGTSGP